MRHSIIKRPAFKYYPYDVKSTFQEVFMLGWVSHILLFGTTVRDFVQTFKNLLRLP
ncbi:hypothetical protein BGZ63DRAFT_381252 [Mariannaea sp. PMI_226]|nr:hypothetical protein BGZ63DRAFT_381252 [Mariannaea sp. PMI_226]